MAALKSIKKVVSVALVFLTAQSSFAGSGAIRAKADCATSLRTGNVSALGELAQIINVNIHNPAGIDPRKRQERNAKTNPYSAVMLLETDQPVFDHKGRKVLKAQSTGFMVSPCYAVATFHGVFGSVSSAPDMSRFRMNLRFKLEEGAQYLNTKARPVAHGNYFGKTESTQNDWVLLEVDGCPGDITGWMEMETLTQADAEKNTYSFPSYPGDLNTTRGQERLWTHEGCRFGEFNPLSRSWMHFCAGMAGSSGGPIVREGSDGVLRVVAMNLGSKLPTDEILPDYSPVSANLAVPVSNFRCQIAPYLRQDVEEFGRANPSRKTKSGPASPTQDQCPAGATTT